ncbi:MAG TPA: thioesterase family protein [Candidatus Binatia bacterium]|nr:thioesterase family protein [Candidatus Binatia bacterium]
MSTQSYIHHHRVTYGECTIGNHVYYARYLDILEAARGEFFRFLGQPLLVWQERDTIFPVIECNFRYRAPARYDDVLSTEMKVANIDRVRLSFSYLVRDRDSGRELVRATTCHVCTSTQEKPKRIPDDLAASLKPFLGELGSVSRSG